MKILLLSSLQPATGNKTTAERICAHFTQLDHTCSLYDVENNGSSLTFSEFDLIVGIHAYRSGRLLQDCQTPYILILGGTDVNQTEDKPLEYITIMTNAAKRANGMTLRERLKLSPKKALIKEDENPETASVVFLLPAGLRDVKDPTYLFKVFEAWHKVDPRIHLVVIGPKLEHDCSQLVQQYVKSLNGIHLLDHVPLAEMHFLMRDADFIINCSKSEGLSAVILEGMALKIPVVARNIPGNASLITHRKNGLLFNSPEEFLQLMLETLPLSYQNKLQQIISLPTLSGTEEKINLDSITESALEYIQLNHSLDQERASYKNILQKCF